MARVFITGSTDGLGRMAAELLIEQGHRVVLHARNPKRAHDAIQPPKIRRDRMHCWPRASVYPASP